MSTVTHLLAAVAGCAAGVVAMCVVAIERKDHEDFRTTSDWEPDPLPALSESALAELGER